MTTLNSPQGAKRSGVKARVVEEVKIFWIITLYLAVLFGSFMVYRRLILAEFGLTYLHYGLAFVEALIIAKVILIGDALRLGRRFEDRPLFFSVIYKSFLFGILVMLFGIVEHAIEGMFHKEGASDIVHAMMDIGPEELVARVVMLIMALVPFFAFWELGRVLGRRRLSALFFSRKGMPALDGDR